MTGNSTSELLASGTSIGGYEIVDVVARGGMSIVYRAKQSSLGREVALKVLSAELADDPQFQQRFAREGALTAGLEHPHVVPIYDQGEADGRMFIAMRLIEGPTLAEQMRHQGLTGSETLRILAAVGDALDMAHESGLIHRDVKPRNILLTRAANPYLTDFGIAKAAGGQSGLTSTGQFIGSINYAAPEQIRGEQLSPATDIYSFTAVLYECLTGKVPFPRDTDAAVMYAHLSDPPPRSTDGTCREFDDLIATGLAKDPEQRFPSAGGAMEAAREALAALGPAAADSIAPFGNGAGPSRLAEETLTSHPRASTQSGVVELLAEPAEIGAADPVRAGVGSDPSMESPAGQVKGESLRRDDAGRVEPGLRGRRRSPLKLLGMAAVPLALLGVGTYLLTAGDAPPKRTVVAGGASLVSEGGAIDEKPKSLPRGFMTGAKTITWSDSTVTIGTLSPTARPAGTLPPAAISPFRKQPPRTYVKAGSSELVRFAGTDRKGEPATAFVLPTAAADQMLFCSGPGAAVRCPRLAMTMSPADDQRQIAPLQEPGAARDLNRIIVRLNTVGRDGLRGLSAAKLADRAGAAGSLRDAYSRAASDAALIRTPTRLTHPMLNLLRSLKGASSSYAALQGAARGMTPSAYDEAVNRVTASLGGVRDAFTVLTRYGY